MNKPARFRRELRDGMAIVLIDWSIKPDDHSVAQFMEWWRTKATIHDKSGLTGEFLSAPVPQRELEFEVNDLQANDSAAKAWRFVNVGVWKDWRTFYEQVGPYMTDELQPFEAVKRKRTVLEPQEWRLGEWPHPPATCR